MDASKFPEPSSAVQRFSQGVEAEMKRWDQAGAEMRATVTDTVRATMETRRTGESREPAPLSSDLIAMRKEVEGRLTAQDKKMRETGGEIIRTLLSQGGIPGSTKGGAAPAA